MGYATVVSSAFDFSACALGCNSRVHTYRQTRTHSTHISCVRVCSILLPVLSFCYSLRPRSTLSFLPIDLPQPLPVPFLLRARCQCCISSLFRPPLSTVTFPKKRRSTEFLRASAARVRRNRRAKVKTLLVNPTVSGIPPVHWRNYLQARAKTLKACTL